MEFCILNFQGAPCTTIPDDRGPSVRSMVDFTNIMAREFTFICPLPNGIHARPASHLAAAANNFISELALTNLRNGSVADLKSVLSMIAADIRPNDECSVRVHGADEQAASAALQSFIENELPAFDVPLPDTLKHAKPRELPRALRAAGVRACFGLAVSRGIGHGKAVIAGKITLSAESTSEKTLDPAREKEQISSAITAVHARMQKKLLEEVSATECAILQAHLAMLDDATLMAKLLEEVTHGHSAEQAIVQANSFFGDLLRQSDNPYTRERALDIQDICLQLLENISGAKPDSGLKLTESSVVVAENLTPQQLLALDRKWIRALVLESAGTTSHTVILARAMEIPTLVGVKGAHTLAPETEILVDANQGFLVAEWTPAVGKFYERESRTAQRRKAALSRYGARPAATSDGHAIEVAANVSRSEEAESAFQNGAEGIGVFRTEMLFLERDRVPTEEEQFQTYAQTVRAANNKPVIFRTFDIGADKPLPFLRMAAEDNPFLGRRGIRVYVEHQQMLRTQLRAILRASAFGHVQVMVPMVSNIGEVTWFKEQLAQVRGELQIPPDRRIPVGIMIEVPSIAFMLDQLCRELDFFSLGTNDLSQYFFAADRGNARVSGLANVREPGFLNFLQQIVAGVHKHGKWIGLCGDMAADPRNLPLLLALGLDEISIPAAEIPSIKEHIAGYSLAEGQGLLSQALGCPRAAEVESVLDREPAGAARGLLERELVLVNNAIDSKEEAIREMVDALYVQGRTVDPDRLEEAIWARESVYSTGLGHGFAVPHCKTDAVNAGSMAVLRLKNPVEWGALDGNPVQIVILMAARESGDSSAHLRIFSRLARNLMDEGFRERLLNAGDRDAMLSLLTEVAMGNKV